MFKNIILSLTLSFFVFSCSSQIRIKNVQPGSSLLSMVEGAVVFGRIKWTHNEKEIKKFSRMNKISSDFKIALHILRIEDMKTGVIEVEKDGHFFKSMPIGTYIVRTIDWTDFWGGSYLSPKVTFQVKDKNFYYYLGTLNLDVKTKRNIFGGQVLKSYDVSIEDDGKTTDTFAKRYPNQKLKIAKAMMIHDPEILEINEFKTKKELLDILRHISFSLIILTTP